MINATLPCEKKQNNPDTPNSVPTTWNSTLQCTDSIKVLRTVPQQHTATHNIAPNDYIQVHQTVQLQRNDNISCFYQYI